MEKRVDLKLILAIVAAGLLSFCGVIVETAMNITFPKLMREFALNTATVQWMTTAYLLVVAIIVPISAFLKRRFRTKTLFVTANLLFILGLVVDATATSFPVLVTGRIIQGMGTGIALPLMFNIIIDWAPARQKGTLMGIGTLITAIAPALGPTFGGLIVSWMDWHWIFVLLIPVLVISLVLGLYAIRQAQPTVKVGFDVVGWLMIVLLFVGFTIGFSKLATITTQPLIFVAWLVVGLIGLVGFVIRTRRAAQPLINLAIFTTKSYDLHLMAYFLVQICALGLAFILPNYIQLVNGKSALLAGLFVLPGAAIGAVFAPLGGRILDSLGEAKPVLTGSTILVIAMALFTVLGMHLSGGWILAIYILLMIGIGLTMGNTMTSGLQQLSAEHQADGNAVFNTMQQFAGAIGTSVVSAVITLVQVQTTGTSAHRTALGSTMALGLLLILVLIELGTMILAMKTRQAGQR
ncbi:DHA2 family efflux MFS transporter permease subunit [Lactiplantibacillus plantarum]|uniref:DHA2 family efflux MFS transporter permease subunit n=1 Tax=Lactiplantibacillus plantarum TaxID=1590 RepID=UPI0005FBDEFB|nr:DHA2 family efflux MFS transporter permease subunit [Lactiplantibacillus plantarum]MCG0570258.1 transport protein [Lactiplantibacillus plantarum]MCG0780613.1 transport protein [Lactiplantibacillus plantarum]UTD39479.1 DHA2 family efflux MFS transporter permease subunit [Lactiplantibacillus plantarum]